MRQVVLVDEQDRELGTADIVVAHQGKGLKHRALSVMLYRKKDEKIEWLLQKRAMGKLVFAGCWGNTCCTNLRPGDEYLSRAVSRLKEEMGIEVGEADLRILYRFGYEAPDPTKDGWCENELDTVIVGEWNPPSPEVSSGHGGIRLDPEEVEEYKWMGKEELKIAMVKHPEQYAPWLKLIISDSRIVRVANA